MSSPTETPWAVHCKKHGKVYLTANEYNWQLNRPDSLWMCTAWDPEMGPCHEPAGWDDLNFEKHDCREPPMEAC